MTRDPIILDDDAPQMEPQWPLVALLCAGVVITVLALVAVAGV